MSRLRSELLDYEPKDVYENGTLRNKFDITDQDKLDFADRVLTSAKLAKLYMNDDNIKPPFDEKKLYSIHKYLFEEIYDFAGEIRNDNIYKSFSFCPPENVHVTLRNTLAEANSKRKTIDSKEKLLTFITELYADVDVIHPFREGNGRALREFIRQYVIYICRTNGLEPYYIDFNRVDRETFINAVRKADAFCEYDDLLGVFTEMLIVREDKQKEHKER